MNPMACDVLARHLGTVSPLADLREDLKHSEPHEWEQILKTYAGLVHDSDYDGSIGFVGDIIEAVLMNQFSVEFADWLPGESKIERLRRWVLSV